MRALQVVNGSLQGVATDGAGQQQALVDHDFKGFQLPGRKFADGSRTGRDCQEGADRAFLSFFPLEGLIPRSGAVGFSHSRGLAGRFSEHRRIRDGQSNHIL